MVNGATVFGLFHQVQVTVTEALSWEQNSMPPALPWELAWSESLAPSLVVGALGTSMLVGRRPPTTGQQCPAQDQQPPLTTPTTGKSSRSSSLSVPLHSPGTGTASQALTW